MKKREKKEKQKQIDIVEEIVCGLKSQNDPNGSYTGRPLDAREIPVQDADDL